MADSTPVQDTARLFLSVPCPASLSRRLEELSLGLEASTWTLRRSEAADLHLTLHFLGATPLRLVDDLKRELGALCHARRRFDLKVGGLGCFPDEQHPRVVYAGIQDSAGMLQELFQASLKLLNAYRLFALRADYRPHLTLARVEGLSAAWDPRLLRALSQQWKDLGAYPVEELNLMRSLLPGNQGPRYEALASLRLE